MPAAAAICINAQGKLLMVLQGKPEEEKSWSIPGGRLEEGESFEAGCVREVWEETGYEIEVKQYLSSKASRAIRYFEATILGGSLKLHDPDELIYEIAWKSVEEILMLKFSYEEDRAMLVEVLRNGCAPYNPTEDYNP